jgi:hypothetical protein
MTLLVEDCEVEVPMYITHLQACVRRPVRHLSRDPSHGPTSGSGDNVVKVFCGWSTLLLWPSGSSWRKTTISSGKGSVG